MVSDATAPTGGTASAAGWAPLVGREPEMALVERALQDAVAGQGRLLIISGRAGMGKTRLAVELSSVARARGIPPEWGRGWNGSGAPACWPWIEVVRSLLEEAIRSGVLGPADWRLTELIDNVALAGLPDARTEPVQFRLFDAIATCIRRCAISRPLVLILDDLHLADEGSLACLSFVAQGLADMAALVVGIWSEGDATTGRQCRELPASLTRLSERISLGGLRESDVGELLGNAVQNASPPTARALHRHTEGNPRFLHEVIRLSALEDSPDPLVDLSWSLPVPGAVRDAQMEIVLGLSEDSRRVVEAAAVIGRDVDVNVLASVLQSSVGEALRSLGPAESAGVVVLTVEPARARFSHAPVRKAIHDQMGPRERVRFHREVAAVLVTGAGPSDETGLGDIARHLYEAAALGADEDRAIDAGIHAAAIAGHHRAFEDQIGHLRRVAILLKRRTADPAAVGAVLLQLGDALARSGQAGSAREVFALAAEVARKCDDAQLLGRAALGAGGRFISLGPAGVDTDLVNLLEEALTALDGVESALRANVLARLSRALFFASDDGRRAALSTEALTLARRIKDPTAEIAALHSMYWLRSRPHEVRSRLAIASEIVLQAGRAGDQEMVLQGHHWRLIALATLGEMAGVDAEISIYRRLAEDVGQPLYLWMAVLLRAMRAFMDGRFVVGERLARRAREEGRRAQLSGPVGLIFDNQMAWLCYEQGRFLEAEACLPSGDADEPDDLDTRTRRALLQCLLDPNRSSELRAEVAIPIDRELPRRAQVDGYVVVLAQLAQLAHAMVDIERAGTLYPLLKPYADQQIVIGTAVAMGGSASHHLGLLASTMSRSDLAQDHFEVALAMNARVGAAPLLARTQLEYARVLAAVPSSERRRAVPDLLTAAGGTARRLGMATLASQIAAVEADYLAGGQAEASVFRCDGQFWTITFEGTTVRVRDGRGLHYLRRLLAYPGREFHVNDLAAPNGRVLAGAGPAGEIIDAPARAAYKRRLDDLRAEVAEAEDFNDAERASLLNAEIDFLLDELKRAYGVGGNPRRWDEPGERARKAVTNRIRAALRNLAAVHPRLGEHLSRTVRTGTYCSYAKEGPAGWHTSAGEPG
ncbi:MAG: ATP-binding protein [Acidimicrobiales bacterium]